MLPLWPVYALVFGFAVGFAVGLVSFVLLLLAVPIDPKDQPWTR